MVLFLNIVFYVICEVFWINQKKNQKILKGRKLEILKKTQSILKNNALTF